MVNRKVRARERYYGFFGLYTHPQLTIIAFETQLQTLGASALLDGVGPYSLVRGLG